MSSFIASPSAEAPVFTPAFNLNAASFTPSFNAATFVPGQGSGYGAPPAGGYGGYGGQPQVGYGGYGGYGGQAQAGHGGFDGSNDAVSPAKAAADAQAAAEQEAAAKAAKEKKAKEKAAQDAEAKAQADAAKAAKEKAAAEKAAWDAKKAEEKAEKAKVDEAKDAEAEKARLDELRKTMEKREHLNIIFIGHVDAGKSTIGGHLMFLTGGVDARTLEKYEREAAAANRESWSVDFIICHLLFLNSPPFLWNDAYQFIHSPNVVLWSLALERYGSHVPYLGYLDTVHTPSRTNVST